MRFLRPMFLIALCSLSMFALFMGPACPCPDADGDGYCDDDDPCPDDPNDECLGECPTGTYVDEYGEVFDLSTSAGAVTGTMDASPVGVDCQFAIEGTSDGNGGAVELTGVLTNDPLDQCCGSFTISGTANENCTTIAGSFTNECGVTGPLTLTYGASPEKRMIIGNTLPISRNQK